MYEFKPDKGCDYQTIFEYEDNDESEWEYEELCECIGDAIADLDFEFPISLSAVNSNWKGQTGTAEAESVTDIANKIFSFGNNEVSLRRNDQGYYFRTASHDKPTGFNIYIEDTQ